MEFHFCFVCHLLIEENGLATALSLRSQFVTLILQTHVWYDETRLLRFVGFVTHLAFTNR
jgi:hypothetical protein